MPTPIVDKSKLSGRAWWTANQGKALYSTSTSIGKLDVTFKTKVTAFKKALTDAGAKISISTTRHSEARAYVLHWAWKVAKGLVTADKVPKKTGVDITWDHGKSADSKKGAQEIISAAS
jgi:hypothetical protein